MGEPIPASAFCSICGKQMKGPWTVHECEACGRKICEACVKRVGGFIFFGGRDYCPYCAKDLTRK